jgi:hypothetical protein
MPQKLIMIIIIILQTAGKVGKGGVVVYFLLCHRGGRMLCGPAEHWHFQMTAGINGRIINYHHNHLAPSFLSVQIITPTYSPVPMTTSGE